MGCLGTVAKRSPKAGYVTASLPPFVGIAMAVSALTAPHGYAAGVMFAAAWMFAILIVSSSAALLILPGTRRTALVGGLSGTMLLGCFYLTVFLGTALDLANWDNRMVRFGPEIPADLVIVFSTEVSSDQIEDFWEHTLSTETEEGRDLKEGIQSVIKISVGEEPALAVSFYSSATREQKETIRRDAAQSSIVRAIFADVAPNDIDLNNLTP